MNKPDGGPAFPVLEKAQEYREDRYVDVYMPMGGMSLRDYFTGQALATLVRKYHQHPHTFSEIASEKAYEYADAMLNAREQA